MEVKAIKNDVDRYAVENRRRILLNGHELWVGPLELQVAFKLWLGSDKDLEDARHLWNTLSETLNKGEVRFWVGKLNVPRDSLRRSRLELE